MQSPSGVLLLWRAEECSLLAGSAYQRIGQPALGLLHLSLLGNFQGVVHLDA
jgi:hypothetical protein